MKALKEKYAFWTLMDQCVVSGSSFLIGVFLTSLIGLEMFGYFSLYWMLVLFVQGFQQALIVMPMYALAPKFDNLQAYLSTTFRQQIWLSVGIFGLSIMVLMCVSWIVFPLSFYHVFWASLIASLVPLQDTIRRILFVLKSPVKVLITDILASLSIPVVLVFAIYFRVESVTLTHVLILITIAKVIAIVVGVCFMPFIFRKTTPLRPLIREHWRYGKHLFIASILQWLSGNSFILIAGLFLGGSSIGALRIIQSLFGLLNVFFLFLENVIPIRGAQILYQKGKQPFKKYIRKESTQYFLAYTLILLFIVICHKPVLRLLFGTSLNNFTWLVPAYGLLYLLIYIGTIYRFIIRTVDKNIILLNGYIMSSIVGVGLCYPLTKYAGLWGVVGGLFLTQIVSLLVYSFSLKRLL